MIRTITLLLLSLTAAPVSAQVAVWNGRTYTGRVCSNPRCGMCAAISSQLRTVSYAKPVSYARPVVEVVPEAIELQWVPMPHAVVCEMLTIIAPQPGETLYDLGCGDGRILSQANRTYYVSVLGIELNPETAQAAEAKMKADGCEGFLIVPGDAAEYSLANADIITLYLYPHVMEKLRWDTLKPGVRVISYSHDIPGLKTESYKCQIDGTDHEFFIHYH